MYPRGTFFVKETGQNTRWMAVYVGLNLPHVYRAAYPFPILSFVGMIAKCFSGMTATNENWGQQVRSQLLLGTLTNLRQRLPVVTE